MWVRTQFDLLTNMTWWAQMRQAGQPGKGFDKIILSTDPADEGEYQQIVIARCEGETNEGLFKALNDYLGMPHREVFSIPDWLVMSAK